MTQNYKRKFKKDVS